MSLLSTLVKEEAADGAVSAGDIAGVHAPIGTEPTENQKRKKKKKSSLLKRIIVGEGEKSFSAADVISKLKAAEKSAGVEDDTVSFGLEDESGNMVKVFVRADQAKEFEAALETALAGKDDEGDNENTTFEIAEVLFDLKDKFDIIDIEWGAIPEDEEENQEVAGDEEGNEGDDELGLGDEEGDDDEMVADEMGGEEDAKTALTQVIDMMKADAEAKKAEAEAKKAEAEAKSAEYASKAAGEKVKQEEEILDMETFNKKKSDESKESKRLAQLAKYKHDLAGENGADVEITKTEIDVSPEEEEAGEQTLSVDELTNLLRRRLQAN